MSTSVKIYKILSHIFERPIWDFQECEHLKNPQQCVKETDLRLSHSVKTCKILSDSESPMLWCVTKGICGISDGAMPSVLSLRLSHWSLVLLTP